LWAGGETVTNQTNRGAHCATGVKGQRKNKKRHGHQWGGKTKGSAPPRGTENRRWTSTGKKKMDNLTGANDNCLGETKNF